VIDSTGSELVDVHSHIFPPVFLDLLRTRSRYPRVATVDDEDRFIIFPEEDDVDRPTGRPIDEEFWSADAKLAFMDRAGIGRTVLSLGNPWLDAFPGPESNDHAGTINDELVRIADRSGGRIVSLGVLPCSSPADAVAVIRTIGRPQHPLRGIVTGPTICGLALDDGRLEPVWQALDDTRLPWMLHPSDGLGVAEMEGYGHALPIALAFPFETTLAVTRFVLAGVMRRHPKIRLLVSHGGGTLPFLAARLDTIWRADPSARTRLPDEEPSALLARLYLDAITYHPRSLAAAVDLAGDKLAFGTDHPFAVADPEGNLAAIDATLEGVARDRVVAGTARELFGM
jgi:predicted TIM-barrel fold metal-dependent hydrolase